MNPFVELTIIIVVFILSTYTMMLIDWRKFLKPEYIENSFYSLVLTIIFSLISTGVISFLIFTLLT